MEAKSVNPTDLSAHGIRKILITVTLLIGTMLLLIVLLGIKPLSEYQEKCLNDVALRLRFECLSRSR